MLGINLIMVDGQIIYKNPVGIQSGDNNTSNPIPNQSDTLLIDRLKPIGVKNNEEP